MKKFISAGGIVKNKENMICLTNENDRWLIPKGTPKPNENLLETAVREIAEETGITKLKLLSKLGTVTRKSFEEGKVVDKEIHVFLFESNQKELNPSDKKHHAKS